MLSNPNRHDHPIRLLDQDINRESWNAIVDVSNAIILPEKRKRDLKVKGKASNKGNDEQEPKLSKSKQKKLKQLQEEKEKKLLQFESIRNLEKYKLWDGAYSLLHSSGTIGQAETLKGKHRRAVQFLKAGLEVPEDISPLKKKGDRNASCESDVSLKHDDDQCHPERDLYKDDNVPANRNEGDACNHKQSVGTYLEPTSKIPINAQRSRTEEIKDKGTGTRVNDGHTHKEPIPLLQRQNKGEVVASQEIHGSIASCQNTDVSAQDHASGPIVVHVTRPKEVEEKRRELPIVMMEQEIMEAINDGSIVIICGETGCGKTTQVPQFLYEAGFGSRNYSDRKGIIGVTQPRRVAVLATAKRVSFELGFRLGKEVGFQVRHDKMIGDRCSIKFMTDGILLREVQSDLLLRRYSVIILDEAHERSLNTDILIGMLSRIVVLRKNTYMDQQKKMLLGIPISPEKMISQLKLVLMSATLRVEDFISNRNLFNETPPLVEVPVRQFPVTIHFSKTTQEDYLGQAYKKVMSIHKRLPPGGILVFVTGQREIEFMCKKLQKASNKLTESNSKRNEDTKMNDSLEVDIKDIDEAFDDTHADPFSTYEDDYDDQVLESDSYESDSESELEDDCEGEDKSALVLKFQSDSESLSSLKASFEALSKSSDTSHSKEGQNTPASPIAKEYKSPGGFYVLPLYAMLPASAQLRVFEEVPEGERLVVVATNVAETSLTIPGIKYVVDTGKEKVKNYNHSTGTATYEVQWISKASASQRAGRAGRTGPGHCYRLYSTAAFSKDDLFPDFSCPEINKIPIDGVVLLMKFMGIEEVANFPFPTAPETEALVEAERLLKALEALNTEGMLTPLGKAMAQYPMSPRHSRMLLMAIRILRNQPQSYARANLVLGYSVATAAALSFPNPFIMQVNGGPGDTDDTIEKQRKKKVKAAWKESRARLCNPSSDAITAAYALQLFELSKNSAEFCGTHLLHLKTMEEMSKLRRQLLQLVFHHSKLHEEFCWNFGGLEDVERSWREYSDKNPLRSNEEEILGQAICAGWADRVARRIRSVLKPSDDDRKVHATRYQSCALKETVYLHCWSSVSRTAPEFIVYTEILHAKRPYMHIATSVKPEWLIKYAGYLCTFSPPLADPKPYYEPLRDETLCWVNPNFGQHNWQLPLHSLPIKNEYDRVSVFACALLEGIVLPCVNTAKKYLAAPPSTILRPEGLSQSRVSNLLSGLKQVDSRAKLRKAWNTDPRAFYSVIRNWFQKGFHDMFGELWEEMQREVLCEGRELFPKRAKKDKKMKLL